MPGWKKNIPICLQAEEQERGEWGDGAGEAGTGVRAGGHPGCLPLPSSLPIYPPADGGGAPRPLGRWAKRGGVV